MGISLHYSVESHEFAGVVGLNLLLSFLGSIQLQNFFVTSWFEVFTMRKYL